MFWIKRNIQAGLASARQKYMLEDGEIPTGKKWIHKDAFAILKTLDPTNTYRYLDKICEWFWDSDEYFDRTEGEFLSGMLSADGLFKKHTEAGRTTSVWYSGGTLFGKIPIYKFDKNGRHFIWLSESGLENFRKLIKQYRDLEEIYGQSKWIIKGLNFRTVKELVDFVREGADYARAQERLIKMKPAVDFIKKEYPEQIVEDSEKAFISKIDSYKMSSELGDKTNPREPWCVQRSMDQWLDYFQKGSCFYYLVDRLDGRQYYVQVFYNQAYYFWNDEDRRMDDKSAVGIVRKLGIGPKLKHFVPGKENYKDLRIYLVTPYTLNVTFGVDPYAPVPDFLRGFFTFINGDNFFIGGKSYTFVTDEQDLAFANTNLDPEFRDAVAWELSIRISKFLYMNKDFGIALCDRLFRRCGVYLPEEGSYDAEDLRRTFETYLRESGFWSYLFRNSIYVNWVEDNSTGGTLSVVKYFSISGKKYDDNEFRILMSYLAPLIHGYTGIIGNFGYYSDLSGLEAERTFEKAFRDALAHISDKMFGGK